MNEPASNLPATRQHMSRMRRAFAPKLKPPIYDRRNCDTTSGYCSCGAFHKPRPLSDAATGPRCKGCGGRLWSYKGSGELKCINSDCEFYMEPQRKPIDNQT